MDTSSTATSNRRGGRLPVHPLLDDRALDGLGQLTVEGLLSMDPSELRRLTGLNSLDDIRESNGKRGNGHGLILLRPSRKRTGVRRMWQMVVPVSKGEQPLVRSTEVPFDTRRTDEARLVVVRYLARKFGKRRLGHHWTLDQVASIDVLSFLAAFHNSTLLPPENAPKTAREMSQEATRVSRVYAVKRIMKAFRGVTLDDLQTNGALLSIYRRTKLASSTIKGDLELTKLAVNLALKRMGATSLMLSDRIPRGEARAKPKLSKEDICNILLATAGCIWEKEKGCWKTTSDPETGESTFVLAPPRRRRALSVFSIAILLALVTASRQNVLLAAKYNDPTAPHVRFEDGFFYREPNDHVATNKRRERVFLGHEISAILEWAYERAKDHGSEHILYKETTGEPYKALNRDIWRETLEMLDIPYFSFHSWKALCVQVLIEAGMTVIEIAEYTATSIETIMRNYKGVDASITHRRPAAAFDSILGDRASLAAPSDVPAYPVARPQAASRHGLIGEAIATAMRIKRGVTAVSPTLPAASRTPPAALRRQALAVVASESAVDSTASSSAVRASLSDTFLPQRGPLTDVEWAALQPLLWAGQLRGDGSENELRRTFNAMIYIASTGASWRSLSTEYGVPDTLKRRHLRWATGGKLKLLREAVGASPSIEAALKGQLLVVLEGVMKIENRRVPTIPSRKPDLELVPLADEEWRVCAQIMGEARDAQRRAQFDAMLYVHEAGIAWKSLPEDMPDPEAVRWRRDRIRANGALEARGPDVEPLDEAQCQCLASRFKALLPPQRADAAA